MNKKAKNSKNKNFWQSLDKPFFVLAPMANVTDYAFRSMFAKYGKPDVMWTEFVSADGLVSSGKDRLMIDLKYSRKERPIVAQLFSGHPDKMFEASKIIFDLGFDGLDLNMGCPDRAVEKQGGGASLIKDPKLAFDILQSARNGVQNKIPVSIKTRIGYNKFDPKWLETILSWNIPVLTIHLRTRKEMSLVPAHWELVPEIVKLRDKICPQTLLIFNGDIDSVSTGAKLLKEYGGDGVMVGRGIFGKPWFFSDIENDKSPKERLSILLEHTKLFIKSFKGYKNFDVMKKHFKAYVSGWEGAKELRVELMEAKDPDQVFRILKKAIKSVK